MAVEVVARLKRSRETVRWEMAGEGKSGDEVPDDCLLLGETGSGTCLGELISSRL